MSADPATPPRAAQTGRKGILLMVAATMIFAAQDGLSRHLAESYNVLMVVMIRFWFFAAFVTVFAARAPGGLAAAVRPRFRRLQVLRGLLLAGEICLIVLSFVLAGLVQTHAVFACCPLLIAALSGPVLGERVGWRRWTAIGAGFAGILVILQPGVTVFSPWSLVALGSALLFALYSLLTRYVARDDGTAVSLFWTGTVGAAVMTAAGLWVWEPMAMRDWGWMALLCCTGAAAHLMLIRVYQLAEASAVQPLAYLQLVFTAGIGVLVFGERLTLPLVLGTAIVVAAGLFTLWRERVVAARTA
jgi:drug/metabolite transporter (DMT)-like permease